MELYINYLHRELQITERNTGRRGVVNDVQRIYPDYSFRLVFDDPRQEEDGWNDSDSVKQKIKNAIIRIYESRSQDSIGNLVYPFETDSPVNCIGIRFGDEDEGYGENVFLQLNNSGWKYYNLPPFGRNQRYGGCNTGKMDPRTIIDGLLDTEDVNNHINKFEIRLRNVVWEFEAPEKRETELSAARIIITSPGEEPVIIGEPSFVFPFPYTVLEGTTNKKVMPNTTPFAILLKGEFRKGRIETKVSLTVRKQYTPDKETMFILSGSKKVTNYKDEDSDLIGSSEEFTGDFTMDYPDAKWDEGDIFPIIPLCATKEEKICDTMNQIYLYYDFADYEELLRGRKVTKDERIVTRHDDEEDMNSYREMKNFADRNARGLFLRSHASVKDFEKIITDIAPIEDFRLTFYSLDEEGYENWMAEYGTQKTAFSVFYYADVYQKNGIRIKRIILENRQYKVCCDLEIQQDRIEGIRELSIPDAIDKNGFKKTVSRELNDMENLSDVVVYFENTLNQAIGEFHFNKNNQTTNTGGNGISDLTPDDWKNEKEVKAGEAIKEPNPNAKLITLDRYLTSYKSENFSYTEDTLHEIGLAISDWLPVIEKAGKCGKSVREYLVSMNKENEEQEIGLPVVRNLAIMGEAGTGKTTLARQIGEYCLGAEVKIITADNLKGLYIGWTKMTIASLVFRLQKDLPANVPAILFLDEAYSLFEQNKEGERGTSDGVDMILKMSEPGEYEFDLSEMATRDMEKMGLIFYANDTGEYEDEDRFGIERAGNGYKITVKKVVKRENTVIWLGGYEDRLRRSFSANEGLNRRFSTRVTIPTPKMKELIKLFKKRMESYGVLSAKSEKEIRNFLTWATSRSRSHLFGNFAGVSELVNRCGAEYELNGDYEESISIAVSRYKNELEKQYKAELMKDIPEMPFEVVTDVGVTFNDYAGNTRLKRRMNGILEIMLKNDEYRDRNISLPKGALLMGPPGTGKTMIARCMAGELQAKINEGESEKNQKDVAFIPTSGAEILATPNPVKAISALFSEAAAYDASIVFIDEIDSIGKKRDKQYNTAPLLQLMKEMDGFGGDGNIFVLAATNDPDSLDEALVRDNRFDIRLEVGLPDKESSISLIRYYLGQYGVDYDKLTREQQNRTLCYLGGIAPASVKSNLNEAAILYHQSENLMLGLTDSRIGELYSMEVIHRRRSDGTYQKSEDYKEGTTGILNYDIFLTDLKEAMDIKSLGNRTYIDSQESFTIDPESNEGSSSVAIHEVGHALVGYSLGVFNIERITILGRGNMLGYVEYKRNANQKHTKKGYLTDIKISMGGRVAEELIYGPDNISTGALADIQDASKSARMMVNLFGFSDKIGFMGMERLSEGYLGDSYERLMSGDIMDIAEQEQNRILKECLAEVRQILGEKKELIIEISRELFNAKEISGDKMEEIYRNFSKKE